VQGAPPVEQAAQPFTMGCQQSQSKAKAPEAAKTPDLVRPSEGESSGGKTPLAISTSTSNIDGAVDNGEAKLLSPSSFLSEGRKSASQGFVVLRVIKAELTKNFDALTKMDPFAIVYWVAEDGSRNEASRTRTDWGGHMTPCWNHTCRSQRYCKGDNIEVQVWEKDVVLSEFCGKARIGVEELLGGALKEDHGVSSRPSVGKHSTLELRLDNGQLTGTVTIQALYLSLEAGPPDEDEQTTVDPALFEAPATRIGVSGGTAPFFNLKLKNPAAGQSVTHYLGKDLSHANDEITFYEEALAEKKVVGSPLAPLLKFMFEYAGVVRLQIDIADKGKMAPVKDLLVMRNLRDGHVELRMLDIKIGQVTSQAGWQGKSRTAAIRQSIVDGLTNSAAEGFRLEGFDNRPPGLTSMDPLLDLGGQASRKEKTVKKATRIMLQRLPASTILMHFLDVHQSPKDPGAAELEKVLSPVEVTEIVLHEVVRWLSTLAVACRKCPVPQKWIGSSVALGFESGKLPERSIKGMQETRKSTHINIFDWGRSELNTISKHMQLSDNDQRDRSKFWGNYVGGIDRLAWEAARAYWHNFNNADGWAELSFLIFDFDSMTRNEFIANLDVPVEETAEKTVKLDCGNNASFTYSITWRPLPEESRMKGTWRVTVHRAVNIPGRDGPFKSASDPFVEVLAVSKDGERRYRQASSVKPHTVNPVWDEVFDVPVALRSGELEASLDAAARGLGSGRSEPSIEEAMLPSSAEATAVEDAVQAWKLRLDSMLTSLEAQRSCIERLNTRESRDSDGALSRRSSPTGASSGRWLTHAMSEADDATLAAPGSIIEMPPKKMPMCCLGALCPA